MRSADIGKRTCARGVNGGEARKSVASLPGVAVDISSRRYLRRRPIVVSSVRAQTRGPSRLEGIVEAFAGLASNLRLQPTLRAAAEPPRR